MSGVAAPVPAGLETAPTAARARGRRAGIAWLAFPVLLWLLATLFLGGDLGPWNDDYQFPRLDPATGEPTRWTMDTGRTFWRPLHFLYTTPLLTAFWPDLRIPHILGAAVHGLCAVLVFRLLRAMGRSWRAAIAGAMFFSAYPAAFETILWPSATSTGIATGLVVIICLLSQRLVSAPARHVPGLIGAMAALAFAAACFNEQPVGALAAMPLIALASRARATGGRSLASAEESAEGDRLVPHPARRGTRPSPALLARIAAAALACALAVMTYIALYITSVEPTRVGTPGTLPSPDRLLSSIPRYLDLIGAHSAFEGYGPGAFGEGWRTLAASPVRAWWAVALLIAAAPSFVRRWGAEPAAPPEPDGRRRLVLSLGAGAAFWGGAWVPIIATGYPVGSRMCLAPIIGVILVAATLTDAVGAAIERSPRARARCRAAGAFVLIVALFPCAVSLVGVQGAMQRRAAMDVEEGAQLLALAPDPPPHAFFLPLRIAATATRTPSRDFDEHFFGPLGVPWAAPSYIERLYRRPDVHAGFSWPWRNGPPLHWILALDGRGIRCTTPMYGPYEADPEGGYRIPWSKIIPFEIDRAGTVHRITRIVIDPDAGIGPPLIIDAPDVARCDSAVSDPPVRQFHFPIDAQRPE